MPNCPFVWYELATTDPTGARPFYERLVGWTTKDSEMPGMTYILAYAGEDQIAGLTTLAEQAKANGAPPHWTGYVGVEDVDASADKAKSLGARFHVEPMDIPNVGRFAVMADPQGAVICLFKGNQAAAPARDLAKVGHFGWHELMTSDLAGAIKFYGALFGWTKGESFDMGEMGPYQLFENGGVAIGGMMGRPPSLPVSYWGYYINVGDIDAAAERAQAAGGRILMGPASVPGGQWIFQAQDPQGAHFACLGARP